MVPLPLALSSPTMVNSDEDFIMTRLEEQVDAHDKKLELLSNQISDLTSTVTSMKEKLGGLVQTMIGNAIQKQHITNCNTFSSPSSSESSPVFSSALSSQLNPEKQPPITTQLQSRITSYIGNSTPPPDSFSSTSLLQQNTIATENIEEYIDEFKVSCALISDLSADQAIEIFISGLHENISNWLRLLNPETCDRAMDLARHVVIAIGHGGKPISGRKSVLGSNPYYQSLDNLGNPNSKGTHAMGSDGYFSDSSGRPNFCNEISSPTLSPLLQSGKPQSQLGHHPRTVQAQLNHYFSSTPVNPTFTSIPDLNKTDGDESTKKGETCSIKSEGVQGDLTQLHKIHSPLLNHTSLKNCLEGNLPQPSSKLKSNIMVSQSTFSSLNEFIKEKETTIPVVRESELHGSAFFSKIDFKLGFYQVGIHKSNVNKTTFVTTGGQHEFFIEPCVLTNTHVLLLKWAVDTTAKINYLPGMYTDLFDLTMGSCLTPYTFLQDEKQTRQWLIARKSDLGKAPLAQTPITFSFVSIILLYVSTCWQETSGLRTSLIFMTSVLIENISLHSLSNPIYIHYQPTNGSPKPNICKGYYMRNMRNEKKIKMKGQDHLSCYSV
ncbi:uncharacterized protein [Rutidosis leptorrhynchoides]|uniref:uncharacterized protein n=1 Tax=Rutidosis leptorrhynchoides TaxID=125765 RepID=UPI003A9A5F75